MYIKEFLRFNKYQSTLECLEAEERTKLVTSKSKTMNVHPDDPRNLETFPRLYRFFESDKNASDREEKYERKIKSLESRLEQVLISARQIFAIAVDSVVSLDTATKISPAADMKEKIENYKIQLGKYQGMLIQDIKGGSGPKQT